MKSKRSVMLRASAVLVSLVAGFAASIAFTAPANAEPTAPALHSKFKLWDVTFSDNNCTGKVTVTLTNNFRSRVGLVFDVDGDDVAVPPHTTKVVDIAYPQSTEIDVDLIGGYNESDPEVLAAKKDVAPSEQSDFFKKHWEDAWERPAGCFAVTATSTCQNTFTVTVKNTGPDEVKFGYVLSGDEEKSLPLAAGASVPLTANKGKTVTLRLDGELGDAFSFTQPTCTTPAPTTTPPVVAPAAPLPVTGSSLTLPLSAGIALVAAGAIMLLAQRRRRLAEVTVTSGSEDNNE